MTAIVAKASANIALVKYWGKSDPATNLPAVDSLSLTLAGLDTITSVEPIRASACSIQSGDIVYMGEAPMRDKDAARVRKFLQLFRDRFQDNTQFLVRTANHFPTGAGLASSASGFAALGTAIANYYGMQPQRDAAELINLVRQGSGSAPRSLYGGFVHLQRDVAAGAITLRRLSTPLEAQIAMLVVIVDDARKPIGSREAMTATQASSPYWNDWLRVQAIHMEQMLPALVAGDLTQVGEIAEQNAQCMHALCHTARPPIYYWTDKSVAALRAVAGLRADGLPAWSTMDAGPQVKVITTREAVERVRSGIESAVAGVRTLVAYPGPGSFFA